MKLVWKESIAGYCPLKHKPHGHCTWCIRDAAHPEWAEQGEMQK